MKVAIKRVFWLYTSLFLMLIIYLIKLSIVDSKEYITNPYNPRLTQSSSDIKRGNIIDNKGNIIAESVANEDGTFKRVYNYSNSFSHVVGYTTKGMSGVESKYNFLLERADSELFQRIDNLFTKDSIEANSIALTINADLQNYASKQLGKSKGAIIAIEPSTGKILAMVSYPDFNPNTIDEDWSKLNSDNDSSPLLNRATQGLYPPGSIFKIVTAISAITMDPSNIDFQMDCIGEKTFGNNKIHCFDSKAHGNETMIKAFAKSCNTYFATIGAKIGASSLIETSKQMQFNADLGYPLENSKSSFALDINPTDSELIETSIGQGKTLVTPLHMAMITSAIANNGIMMKPYLVDHIQSSAGSTKNRTVPKMLANITTQEICEQIKTMMEEVVVSGTAKDAVFYLDDNTSAVTSGSAITSGSSITTSKRSEKISVAGKTGTAENPLGKDHAWFVAFAPADNPQIAIAVVLENSGKGSNAIPIAKNVMKKYLSDQE